MKALLIIDVQNDFMPTGALPVPEGDHIVPVINRLMEDFSLIIATQDWHPINHISFASNHEGKKPFDIIEIEGYSQTLWPDHCVQGTQGADFHPQLNTNLIETIFRKGTDPEIDSYSGFYDNLRKKSTGLAGYLKDKNIKEIYCTGLAADICVYYTIQDALSEGFSVTLVEDGTKALDQKQFEKIKEELSSKGVHILRSTDIKDL